MLYIKNRVLVFAILVLSILFSGCSKDTETINQAEHFQAIGMVITDASGAVVFSILRGVTNDTLVAPLNARSEAYFVSFYDENEQIIQPPADGDKYLAWEIDDNSFFKIFQHEGEEGGYEFHLDGLKEGVTSLQFFVMHNGHADYRTGLIPVKVKSVEGSHGEPVKIRIADEETDGTILFADLQGNITDTIKVQQGVTTDHMVVYFIDEEGREFQPSISEHSAGFVVDNSTIAEVTGLVVNEPYAFKIKGNAVGVTKLTVQLKHGGTVDMSFSLIPIKIY